MRLEELLKNNHLKVTPQRMAILREIEKAGHINIEEIYDQIRPIYPSMSLATIYKNLTSMQEANIVRELKLPHQKQKYELCCHPHVHLVCEKCGKLEDLDISYAPLMKKCEEVSHYQLHDASLAMIGICPECQTTSN
ncbi:MAG: Fur family transcriptional regulator [Wolinella sp.]